VTRPNVSKAREEFPEIVNRADLAHARAALKEAEMNGTVPLRDLMRELGD